MNAQNSTLPAGNGVDFRRDLVALIPFLRAFAHSLCHNRHQGEDLAQDTLVKAWKAQARFELGTNLKAWVFTILRNEYYSQRRRSWRQTHWDEIESAKIAAPPDLQYWSLALSDTENALQQLPDLQREAVILVAAGGVSYDDAAEICNVPVGTVKSRVARGRAALFEMMEGKRKLPRRSSRPGTASDDILAQLSALTSVGAHSSAHM
jgi:RNA polymerase sigma-70 factor (ECF subfamily)